MNKIYVVVEFPMVQKYQEEDWFDKEAILLNDENSLNQFSSSAYMIPIERTMIVTSKPVNKNKLYKLRSGDESVHAIIWAKDEQEAIELANKELKDSCELFKRDLWQFDEDQIEEIELKNKSKTIDFIDAYTF